MELRETSTRQKIIDAAAFLFHTRSYIGVGVSDICQMADIPKGSFYHFFKSKDDVALAVIDFRWSRFDKFCRDVLANGQSPVEQLREILNIFYRIAVETQQRSGHVAGCPFGNLASELATVDEPVRQRLLKVNEDLKAFLRILMDKARDRRQLRNNCDIEASCNTLLAIIQGASVIGKVENNPETIKSILQSAIESLQQ